MEQLNQYRSIIRDALSLYSKWTTPGVRGEIVVDPTQDHYEVIRHGWEGHKRLHHSVLHLDVIDGKVWIQHDSTDRPVAEYLVERGVPKSDIVLGFQSPQKRELSGYAVA